MPKALAKNFIMDSPTEAHFWVFSWVVWTSGICSHSNNDGKNYLRNYDDSTISGSDSWDLEMVHPLEGIDNMWILTFWGNDIDS